MAMPVMPRESGEWTVDDLDDLPDDGLQYELLLVSPAPVRRHQRAVARLHLLLAPVVPQGVELLFAPFDWRPDRRTSLQPDLLAFRDEAANDENANDKNATGPLVLAVEVLSPSARRKDQVPKRSKYEDCGVEHFWVVDPEAPSITTFALVGGHYVESGTAKGQERLEIAVPFALSVVPADLVRGPSLP